MSFMWLALMLSVSSAELNLYQKTELECLDSYVFTRPSIGDVIECRDNAKKAVLANESMAATFDACMAEVQQPTAEDEENCLIEASRP